MYFFIPDLPLNFTLCSSMLFSLSHLMAHRKTSNSFMFYRRFCYLQNVDFERSHKNGFESLSSEYRHYRSDYLFSSIQQSSVTYWFILRNAFSSSLVTVKFFHYDEYKVLIIQLSTLVVLRSLVFWSTSIIFFCSFLCFFWLIIT